VFDKTEKEVMDEWKGDIKNPAVSIVCATYNHEEYISEALDGFLMQKTDFPFEILIGEDCSTDRTRQVVMEYHRNFPNIIKPIFWKVNVGAGKNWCSLLNAARGKYIANCEGDDFWTNEKKLQTQVDDFLKHPEYKLSFHACSQLSNDGSLVKPKLMKMKKFYSVQDVINGHFHLLQTNTLVFRRNILDNLSMDLLRNSPVGDVWIRTAAAIPNGAIYTNRDMSVYRIHSNGSWSSSMIDSKQFLIFVARMLQSIDDFDSYWEFKYTKEFHAYKNNFIKSVYRNSRLTVEDRAIFLEKNSSFVTVVDKLKWSFLYKHSVLISFLSKVKAGFIKTIV